MEAVLPTQTTTTRVAKKPTPFPRNFPLGFFVSTFSFGKFQTYRKVERIIQWIPYTLHLDSPVVNILPSLHSLSLHTHPHCVCECACNYLNHDMSSQNVSACIFLRIRTLFTQPSAGIVHKIFSVDSISLPNTPIYLKNVSIISSMSFIAPYSHPWSRIQSRIKIVFMCHIALIS